MTSKLGQVCVCVCVANVAKWKHLVMKQSTLYTVCNLKSVI